jgi:hypothetical protein
VTERRPHTDPVSRKDSPSDTRDNTVASPKPARRFGFGMVLLALLVIYASVVGFGDSRAAGAIRPILLAFVLVIAARLGSRAEDWRKIAAGAVAATVVAGVVAWLVGEDRIATMVSSAAVVLLVVGAIVTIGRVLVRRPVADLETVAGALAVYLLLALLFSALHQLLAAALGQPYANGISNATDSAAYLYFSVITIATVGFGDITPACAAARAVTMAEALVGQLYLVAVVGSVVGNWVRPSRGADRSREHWPAVNRPDPLPGGDDDRRRAGGLPE